MIKAWQMTASVTDFAIAVALHEGHLTVSKRQGRDGRPYWTIEDADGIIEVHLSLAAAEKRINDVGQKPLH